VARISIGFGIVLILLGVGAYFGTGQTSVTALIPSAFGAALLLLGLVALKEHLRKHAMHLAAMVGLIGAVGGAGMAVPKLPTLLREGHVLRADGSDATVAIMVQLALAVICLVFVGLCVNSFVQARRRQRAAGTP
jgi:uncharacterized protein involved in response to NO